VNPLEGLDANAGNPVGIGELQENKIEGRREISSSIYPLNGTTILTDTLVEKIIIENTEEKLTATGIKLENGTEIRGHNVLLAAGALRSPQILMLSGVGPADELAKVNVPNLVDQPDVGKNLADHGLFFHAWSVKDPSAGWAIGSDNPLFAQKQYGWGSPSDFLVTTDVPKEGLAAAIEDDEGIAPDPTTHSLLSRSRPFAEHIFMYAGGPDGSLVTLALIMLLPTARGTIKLASAQISDPPLIDPNFLGTAVDRYVAREAVKTQLKFATSTEVGREILNGEVGAPSAQAFTADSTDEYIDARLRAGLG
jgi:choline dehydrogenase-like flavoprotein